MNVQLKLVIADDEPMVCVVIKDAINFNELGLTLSGTAHDGYELLRLITEQQPDIVVTDISMPGMSGLDVIEETRKRGLTTKFVIVSGYSQFEYAQRALKFNVDDYILKPIAAAELNDALMRIKTNIIADQSDPSGIAHIIHDHQKSKETLRKLFLVDILLDRSDLSDASAAHERNIQFQDGCFLGAAVKIDSTEKSSENREDLEPIHIKIIGMMNKLVRPLCFDAPYCVMGDIIYFILNYSINKQDDIIDALEKVMESAEGFIDLFQNMRISIGLSQESDRSTDLKTCLNEAKRALYYRLELGSGRIIRYKQASQRYTNLPDAIRNETMQECQKAFESLKTDHFIHTINRVFSIPHLSPEDAVTLSLDLAMMFHRVMHQLEDNHSKDTPSREALIKGIINAANIIQLREYLIAEISLRIQHQISVIKSQNAKPVRDAIAYIHMHSAEAITLEQVAEAVMLSPAYFSGIFKKETGENYIDFLNSVRIENAKEQLRSTNHSIQEIASNVGIPNPKYFAKVFRKFIGLKPSEYRNIYG